MELLREDIIPNKKEEKLAVDIVDDYLKEEESRHIKHKRSLTKETGGEPPDQCFKIGDLKIACEVTHFDSTRQLAKEIGDKRKIVKQIQKYLQKQGLPPLGFVWGFIKPPKRVGKNAETIANLITMMHNESITNSQTYEQNNPQKYYRLFIKSNISSIMFYYKNVPDGANIDKKYPYLYNVPVRPGKPIKVEEMQAVITKKDKKIPNYKKCYDYDQKWLIITNYQTIDFFILKGAAKEAQYECNFDKVFYIQSSWIDPKTRKQKPTGSRTDDFTVYELKTKPHKKKQGEN